MEERQQPQDNETPGPLKDSDAERVNEAESPEEPREDGTAPAGDQAEAS